MYVSERKVMLCFPFFRKTTFPTFKNKSYYIFKKKLRGKMIIGELTFKTHRCSIKGPTHFKELFYPQEKNCQHDAVISVESW